MRNDDNRIHWHAALAILIAGAAVAVADDTPPQPAPSTAAPAETAPAQPAEKAAAKPAKPAGKNDVDDDEGAAYEKNAAKRFTPTERTPADKNVSFPVDI